MSIVLDSSVVAESLLGSPSGLIIRNQTDPTNTHISKLALIETASILRGLVRGGRITAQRGEQALEDLENFFAHRWDVEPSLRRIWQLRDNFTAYDATHIALAESLHAVFWTTDKPLATAALSLHICPVRLFEPSN
jgi:predicted nucleic acid-binding protein